MARGEKSLGKISTMIYWDVFKKSLVFFGLPFNTIDKCFRLHNINLVSNFLTPNNITYNALNKNHLS
jgi:hypothetical protein